MAKGMVVTLRHMLSPAFTADYPWKKRELPERSRTSFAMPLDNEGASVCKSCLLCEKSCPVGAIHIVSEKRQDGPGRELLSFTIDLGTCMYCGLCVENCTSLALRFAGDYETATARKDDLTVVLYEASPRAAAPSAEQVSAAEEVMS